MVGFSELKAFSWSHIKPMTTNGLQLGPSERLSEYFFPSCPHRTLLISIWSPEFFCAAGRREVRWKKHSVLLLWKHFLARSYYKFTGHLKELLICHGDSNYLETLSFAPYLKCLYRVLFLAVIHDSSRKTCVHVPSQQFTCCCCFPSTLVTVHDPQA